MSIRKHLLCVAWMFFALGLIHIVPGTLIAVAQWRQAQGFSGVGEGISLIFAAFGVLVVGVSLIYFRVALVYFRTASERLFFPGRVAVILAMIMGFPYGTAAGAYALYVRSRHMLNPEETEPDYWQIIGVRSLISDYCLAVMDSGRYRDVVALGIGVERRRRDSGKASANRVSWGPVPYHGTRQ